MKPSEMDFDQLVRIGMSYYADFEQLQEVEAFEIQLTQLLGSGAYYFNGELLESRHLVEKIGRIKIEIYSNEHPPPHFHISMHNAKASLRLDNCDIIENTGFKASQIKTVQTWFLKSKERLIEVWNETRPSDCVVGIYEGD